MVRGRYYNIIIYKLTRQSQIACVVVLSEGIGLGLLPKSAAVGRDADLSAFGCGLLDGRQLLVQAPGCHPSPGADGQDHAVGPLFGKIFGCPAEVILGRQEQRFMAHVTAGPQIADLCRGEVLAT